MAFNLQYLQNFSGSGNGPKLWGYASSTDDATAILAAGYFNTAANLVTEGDRIFAEASDGQIDLVVSDISATGVVTVVGPSFQGSVAWNPASIADGAIEAKSVTVTGAEVGDFCLSSLSVDVQDLVLDAQVTAANTVTAILVNNTGGAVNLNAGTLKVRVIK